MSNQFSKQEKVAFEEILEGFEDRLLMNRNVRVKKMSDSEMERSDDTFWRPQPYIAQSFDGQDQTANFKDQMQLSVPATIGYEKSSPWIMTATQLRDALQEGRLAEAAKQKLASDINRAVLALVCLQGTMVVKRTTAATGYDDVAQIDSLMNEQGIGEFDRHLALNSRDYNNMAKDLAARGTMTGKPEKAYETSFVGRVAGFDTWKLDYSRRIAAAAGGAGLTMDTRVAGANFYTPRATSVATTGEKSNVDNRYQTVTVSSTTNVAAGDAFTLVGVNAVHHITKEDTGQLKTFRVISVSSSTTMVISPPIVSAQGATDAEKQYQNVVVSGSGSATAAIVFLNTVAAMANPFWHKDSIEILPSRYAIDEGSGLAVMRGSTEQGIELVMTKSSSIDNLKCKFRVDARFGVVNLQPEMSGIMLFSQT